MNEQPPIAATTALPAANREQLAAVRVQLLADARHRVALRLPRLLPELYSESAEWEQLKRIATSGRGAQIRMLLHDPAAALRHGHRLIALAQRLPSVFWIRAPVEEIDLAWPSSCLLIDDTGYLFQPDADRAHGRADRADRAAQAPLRQHFDDVWERSARATMLQPLDL